MGTETERTANRFWKEIAYTALLWGTLSNLPHRSLHRSALALGVRKNTVENNVENILRLFVERLLPAGEVIREHRARHQVAHGVRNAVNRHFPDAALGD